MCERLVMGLGGDTRRFGKGEQGGGGGGSGGRKGQEGWLPYDGTSLVLVPTENGTVNI